MIAPRSSLYTLIETARITKATYLICQLKVSLHPQITDPSVPMGSVLFDRQHSLPTCWNSDTLRDKTKHRRKGSAALIYVKFRMGIAPRRRTDAGELYPDSDEHQLPYLRR